MRTRKTDRKQVAVQGQCCSAQGRVFDILLCDLTKGGCGFADPDGSLKVGAPVNLMICGTGPHGAYVRWAAKGQVGVSFNRPFDEQAVEAFIAGTPPKTVPAPAPSPSASAEAPASNLPLRRVC